MFIFGGVVPPGNLNFYNNNVVFLLLSFHIHNCKVCTRFSDFLLVYGHIFFYFFFCAPMIFDVKSEFGGCIIEIVKRRMVVHHNYLFMSWGVYPRPKNVYSFITNEKCLYQAFIA